MLFSGNDFFKLTKTFAVVHLDCECRHGGRQGRAPYRIRTINRRPCHTDLAGNLIVWDTKTLWYCIVLYELSI